MVHSTDLKVSGESQETIDFQQVKDDRITCSKASVACTKSEGPKHQPGNKDYHQVTMKVLLFVVTCMGCHWVPEFERPRSAFWDFGRHDENMVDAVHGRWLWE